MRNSSASSSDLLSEVFDSAEESESSLLPLCDCYWVATCIFFFPARELSSEIALMAFGIQPDLLLAITMMVMDIAWSPRMSFQMECDTTKTGDN